MKRSATHRCNSRHTIVILLVVTSIVAGHYAFSYSATRGASSTMDEVIHMAGGYSYWTTGDYRLHPENGILPQRWSSLPLLLMDLKFPSPESPLWQASEAFLLGHQFLYRQGNDPDRMLAASRAMAACWSTALCVVVFLWARSLFGTVAGLVSLTLIASWPAVVAHGPLATSDACGALFFCLGAWSLWLLLQRVTPGRLLFAFLAVGLAAVAKHTNIVLGPLGLVFAGLSSFGGRPLQIDLGGWQRQFASRAGRLGVSLLLLLVPLLGAVAMIWAAYGFRYTASPTGLPVMVRRYETLAFCNEQAGGLGPVCGWLAAGRLLPEGWINGLSYVAATVRERNAFALGHYSTTGWWWYFPLCFAIKNTLPGLLLAVAGLAAAVWRLVSAGPSAGRGSRRQSLPLIVSIVMLWGLFLTSRINIGERHMLPVYPLLAILAGGVWPLLPGRRWQLAVVAMLGLQLVDVGSRWPASLAYFNQVVPAGREYRWLVDSNLDWGQDLRRLGAWLERHRRPHEAVFWEYFGTADPRQVLPTSERLTDIPAPGEPQQLIPGLYCISATHLQSVYHAPLGPWCVPFEQKYQRLKRVFFEPASEQLRRQLAKPFSILQAGRLLAYLRQRPPDADVGRSILIYRLSAADLTAALEGPPVELEPISWMQRDAGATPAELVARGRRELANQNFAAAERALETARRLDPGNQQAWQLLVDTYSRRRRFAKALQAVDRLIALDPTAPLPYRTRGRLHQQLGRQTAAAADFARYRQLVDRLNASPTAKP